jgi:hypothetical protein
LRSRFWALEAYNQITIPVLGYGGTDFDWNSRFGDMEAHIQIRVQFVGTWTLRV